MIVTIRTGPHSQAQGEAVEGDGTGRVTVNTSPQGAKPNYVSGELIERKEK